MTDLLVLLEQPETWDWRDVMGGEAQDRPVVVAYDIKDLLANIQRGVDAANSALALKADKTDLAEAKRTLHDRIDHVQSQVELVQQDAARASGWRSGFLVAVGVGGGLVTGLVLRLLEVV